MAQSHEHLMSMLWGQKDAHVHAFIRGDVVPGLRQRLASSAVRDWDCLARGAISADEQAHAIYVADLDRQSDFTHWLLTEALSAYPDWGMLGVGAAPLMKARELGRSLQNVSVPGGQVREWNWVDPVLWCGLLPQLDGAQLQVAFGCMDDWVRITATEWQWHTLSAGQLRVSVRPCAHATA